MTNQLPNCAACVWCVRRHAHQAPVPCQSPKGASLASTTRHVTGNQPLLSLSQVSARGDRCALHLASYSSPLFFFYYILLLPNFCLLAPSPCRKRKPRFSRDAGQIPGQGGNTSQQDEKSNSRARKGQHAGPAKEAKLRSSQKLDDACLRAH